MMNKKAKAEAEAYLTEDRLIRWNHLRNRAKLEDLTKEQAVLVWMNMTPQGRQDSIARLG